MDNPQLSPRLSVYQRTFARSAPAHDTNALAVADMPLVTPPRPFGSVRPYGVPDFAQGAKSYKRSQIKRKAFKVAIIFSLISLLIILALGAIGYALNQRYAGRALPYTYVGDLSIGGLTQPEIKAVLDKRSEELRVTLTEGGLTREVPVNTFGAHFDTQKASEEAITGFNPFSYLTKRSFTVPVEVNERYVDGYLRMYVADKQTNAENAEIIKTKKGLSIEPEIYGFRTSTAYVTEQLNKELPKLDDPIVSLSAATDRPTITQADLQDDVDTARNLIATKVGVKAYNSVIRPTDDQKLSWLEIKQIPNSSEVQIQFSQSKVREYVFEIAKKYVTEPVDEQIVTNPDGTRVLQQGKSGSSVANIDEVAKNLYNALMGQQASVIAFTISPVEYKKIDPALLPQQQPTIEAAQTAEQNTTDNQPAAITPAVAN